MNERLNSIVDLESYPIHELSSKKIKDLIRHGIFLYIMFTVEKIHTLYILT